MDNLIFKEFMIDPKLINMSSNSNFQKWKNQTNQFQIESHYSWTDKKHHWRLFANLPSTPLKSDEELKFTTLQEAVAWIKQYSFHHLPKKKYYKMDFSLQRISEAEYNVKANPIYNFVSSNVGFIRGYSGKWFLTRYHRDLQHHPSTYLHFNTRKKLAFEIYTYVGNNLLDLFNNHKYLNESQAIKLANKEGIHSYNQWQKARREIWWCLFLKPGVDLNKHLL